jgi:UDP-3-O-[3-hydroxymyristoyl] N-acetylglucosamine deacetylase
MLQKTIKKRIDFSGIGLHIGSDSRITILPSEADSGICFVRKDLPGTPRIMAEVSNVVSTSYATTLGTDGATVSTVEHLLAAFYGLGVDNALVEVEGPEIPVLDGSAEPFVEMITEAGLKTLESPKMYMVITKPIKVAGEGNFIHLIPSPDMGFDIDYTIDFPHPLLDAQTFSMSFSSSNGDAFSTDVAGARTFGFLRDVELLRANGLAKGGSLDNAVVVGEKDILNEGGLRYPDEFVRHKVLDFLGDLSLVGMPVIGRVIAHRAGHALNFKLAQKVVKNPGRWQMVDSLADTVKDGLPKRYLGMEEGLATA